MSSKIPTTVKAGFDGSSTLGKLTSPFGGAIRAVKVNCSPNARSIAAESLPFRAAKGVPIYRPPSKLGALALEQDLRPSANGKLVHLRFERNPLAVRHWVLLRVKHLSDRVDRFDVVRRGEIRFEKVRHANREEVRLIGVYERRATDRAAIVLVNDAAEFERCVALTVDDVALSQLASRGVVQERVAYLDMRKQVIEERITNERMNTKERNAARL